MFTEHAVTAGIVSQLDSPLPGPGDLAAIGIMAVCLYKMGALGIEALTTATAPAPTSRPPAAPPPSPPPPAPPRREKPDNCPKIKEEIDYLITTERPKTESGFPQGYKGLAQRWREYATNEGKWGYKLDGSLGTRADNHLKEYKKERGRLMGKLDDWTNNQCDDKGHTLPANARQYAAQEPQLGPGKPLGPAPMPIYDGIAKPTATAPQVKKP